MQSGGAASAVPAGPSTPPTAARVDGEVRTAYERAAGSDGRLPQRAARTRRATVTNRHGTAVREYPSELEIVTTRRFDAPIALVFDVLTRPEHVRRWGATGGDRMTICEIDLRVGGDFHNVFVTPDGTGVLVPGHVPGDRPTHSAGQHLAVRRMARCVGDRDPFSERSRRRDDADYHHDIPRQGGPCSHGQGARSCDTEQRRQRAGRELRRDGGPADIAR